MKTATAQSTPPCEASAMTDPKLEELARELASTFWSQRATGNLGEFVLPYLERAQKIQPEPSADVEELAGQMEDAADKTTWGEDLPSYQIMAFAEPFLQRAEAGGVKEGRRGGICEAADLAERHLHALADADTAEFVYEKLRALIESEEKK